MAHYPCPLSNRLATQVLFPDDEALSFHTDVLYDGLYAYLSREVL